MRTRLIKCQCKNCEGTGSIKLSLVSSNVSRNIECENCKGKGLTRIIISKVKGGWDIKRGEIYKST